MASSARTVTLGLGISIVLHVLGLLWVRGATALPDVGLELTRPDAVEFGFYDAPVPANPPSTPVNPAPASEPKTASNAEADPVPAPGPQAEHKAATRMRAPKHDSPDADTEPAAKSGALANFSPRGAQLALRLDLDRVRDSALSEDVGALLSALPDVRLLLEGSGVVPMRDLSRLFLASPDLRRSHVVMAGRYLGDDTLPKSAVDNLARARGTEAAWRKLRGIPVAPWQNADSTARVLALIGPGLFAITREEDLARVLAVARTLASRKQLGTLSDAAAAQALLAMADGELLGLSVENAKSFVRGPHAEQAPNRIQVSIRQTAEGSIEVESQAQFASAEQAQAAELFWTRVREQYAKHPLVALIGLADVLHGTRLAVHDDRLTVHSTLPVSRARMLLTFARDALNRPVPELRSTWQDDSRRQE